MRRALGFALAAAGWLTPPPVLPVPSRSGSEGPPRPLTAEPQGGPAPAPTSPALVRIQDREMLHGPFPSGGLVRGVSDGLLLESPDPETRQLALERVRGTGAAVVRIPVNWRELVAPDPPSGFDPADPSDPSYDFARLDEAVRSAAAAGLTAMLVVSHAPAFAEAPGRWPYAYAGSWAPSPESLQAFAEALARRYDGDFPDPHRPGATLPLVRYYQAWNEPNLARYLEPQWVVQDGRWTAFSPLLYRQLLNAFYAGVKGVAANDVVITAGVAPNGEPAGVGRMAPVTFLASMLCLTGPAGSARAPCPEPAHFDVLAFHPLSVGDPDTAAASSLDVSIADAAKVTGLLRRAELLGTALPRTPKPLWVTELNWESAPQSSHGVLPGLQAGWIARALHRLWIAGVGLVDWQFLVDPYPAVRSAGPSGEALEYQRPAGLYAAGPGGSLQLARPKP
ncbi:MAG TPA: cellulase family glycosylhydrolase, partial [Solirubrobacteraceae bacterium]|nr:cellulase family glycosylhydrolase [Solirubrobacteraceae bacterium]